MTLTGNPELVHSGFDNPPKDPLLLFQKWVETAVRVGVCEPYAMVLSTVDASNRPSSRVVLLKEWDDTGVIFGTNQESQKGRDLQDNPYAAGTLWWQKTMQQINICGYVTQLSHEKSDALFYARTRQAQAVTALSKQSAPLTDESVLRDKVLKLIETHGPIERPQEWRAYHLSLESIEFWLGCDDRFHQRLQYNLINGKWQHQKLQP